MKPAFQKYTWEQDLTKCGPEKSLLSCKSSIFVHENKVSLTNANQFTGVNRKSNKRWFRWETASAVGFRANHNGTVIPFSVTKDGRRFHASHQDPFAPRMNYEITQPYIEYVDQVFGITSPSDLFPMLKVYGLEDLDDIPHGMYKDFRTTNERDFTKLVFGKSNFRRDLLKAVCSSTPGHVAIAKQFRNLVPIDWIINWLNVANPLILKNLHVGLLRKQLLQLSPRSYRRLLQDTDIHASRFMEDITRWRYENNVRDVRSFSDWHDQLWGGRHQVRRSQFQSIDIKPLPLSESLHNTQTNDLTIVTAQHTDDMYKWSEEMSNCISGYLYEATTGKGIYGAVVRGNKTIANYEIRDGKLKQLLGRFNQQMNTDARILVVDTLSAKGVDCSGDWWGK